MSSPFEQMSAIMDLGEINDFMDDPRVEKALIKLTSVLGKQDINPIHVAKHVVECEALSAYFSLKAKEYQILRKDEPNARDKKGFYYTLHESFHELAASLKYLAK